VRLAGDGVVTKPEYVSTFADVDPQDPIAQSVHMFDYVDMDHDGLFLRAEWPESFHSMDTNSKSTFHSMDTKRKSKVESTADPETSWGYPT
jgi:hypothetical protein